MVIALDHGGPCNVEFEEFSETWVRQGIAMNPENLVRILQSSCDALAADGIDRRPTIFLLPGLDGDEPRLAAFRAALSDRMHFVLIDYPDWPEMVERGRSFDVMVESAISQIIAAVPTGDLLLAGYSYGGDVAFAVASRLIESGRMVSFLGILDTDLHHVAEEAEHFRDRLAMADRRAEILNRPRDALGTALGFLLAKCARDVVGLERALYYNWAWRPLLSGSIAFAFDRRIRRILRARARWLWFLAKPFVPIDVPIVLFRSSGHAANTAADLGWQARCSELSIREVPGDHHTMWDPPHRAALCVSFADAVESGAQAADTAERVH